MSMKSKYNLPSRSPFQKIYDLIYFLFLTAVWYLVVLHLEGLFPMEASEGEKDPIILIETPFLPLCPQRAACNLCC